MGRSPEEVQAQKQQKLDTQIAEVEGNYNHADIVHTPTFDTSCYNAPVNMKGGGVQTYQEILTEI